MKREMILPVLLSFGISLALGPVLIPFLRKVKAGQKEREEGVPSHQKKAGTPTMGGVMFLAAFTAVSLLFRKEGAEVVPVLFLTLGFGLIGFLDDYLKVVLHRSDGLYPKQKMALQAVITAVYQDGKVVQVLGGGECQVSSTLFSAILYTDLDVLERANHSMPVHYVPSGMDATVFWDSPDFKFENNHKYPVKIVMNMDSSDTLTVKILGTKENDYTIEPRVEQIDEMSNVTYRDYKDASGNVVKSESVCASKYKPLNSGS